MRSCEVVILLGSLQNCVLPPMRKRNLTRAVCFTAAVALISTAIEATEPAPLVLGDPYSLPTCVVLETDLGKPIVVTDDFAKHSLTDLLEARVQSLLNQSSSPRATNTSGR